jgi:ABC-type transport system substrate-binding protein
MMMLMTLTILDRVLFFGQANWYDYKNPEYDELLKKLLTTDRAERVKVSPSTSRHTGAGIYRSFLFAAMIQLSPTELTGLKGGKMYTPLYWNIVDIKQLLTIKTR